MIYYDYPKDKIELFEASDKNYFFKGNEFSYLCSYEEIKSIDIRDAFSGLVLVIYKRYAVVQSGDALYKNEKFLDGNIASGRYKENGYVIISNKAREYFIHSWNGTLQSYELRDDSKYNRALNPIIFDTVDVALETAIELSKDSSEMFIISQWFDEFDRH